MSDLLLSYSAISDVGRVRKDNQDSGYAGPWLLSVADGVGGAVRGDLASSTAIQEIQSSTASSHGPAYPESWLSLRTRPTSEIAEYTRCRSAIYFLSSRMVLPIRTCVPRVRVVGWVMRTVPT